MVSHSYNHNKTSGKKVAVLQSNYIPWKGYFDLIASVDIFILFDDTQYTRRDWRNRNIIKTSLGCRWLTIPVKVKGKYRQKIKDTEIVDSRWPQDHWRRIKTSYSRAAYFKEYSDLVEELYMSCSPLTFLSDINHMFLRELCRALRIQTPILQSMDFSLVDGKTERLIDLCLQVGGTTYVSGPAGKTYIEEELFFANGLNLEYMEYSDYPEYQQLYPPFEHKVSIIDLLFHVGPEAPRYIWGWRDHRDLDVGPLG